VTASYSHEAIVSTFRVALVLTLILLMYAVGLPGPHGASPMAQINRVFYLSSSQANSPVGTLSPTTPSGSGLPSTSNITAAPFTFILQTPLLSPTTVLGQPVFSVWTDWTGNMTGSTPNLVGTFSYQLPGNNLVNVSSTPHPIGTGLSHLNFTLAPQNVNLLEGTSMSVQLAATSLPRHSNVTIEWGSGSAPSFVVLPLSGYASLFQITILNRNEIPTTYFNNETAGNDVVLVKLLVNSALGCSDISKVNMTIVDPLSRPALGAFNRPMTETPLCPSGQNPYEFIAAWPYGGAAQETYQVWLDIVDIQGNIAYSYRGPTSFELVPPNFIPPPYNLIPYIAGGGGVAGIVGGGFYYRRRREKSYLAPFDHFNTLTAGELAGGTVSIEGNTGSGKTILSEQLMFEDLKRGKPCIFVSTGDFPSNVRSGMKSMGLDTKGYEQGGLLTFIDGYSAEAGQESTEKLSVPSIGDLTTLGMKISSSIPSTAKGASLYFDSLVPLASKTKPESIVSFVQSVGAKMKGIGGKAVFTLGPSVDPLVQKQLEDMSDCVVQMEAFEERGVRRRRLKIAKLRARRHQEGWSVFAIEDGKGIIFYSKKAKT
jgi:KaiC/GvpD/RAD55 family RecA-like ATPase